MELTIHNLEDGYKDDWFAQGTPSIETAKDCIRDMLVMNRQAPADETRDPYWDYENDCIDDNAVRTKIQIKDCEPEKANMIVDMVENRPYDKGAIHRLFFKVKVDL